MAAREHIAYEQDVVWPRLAEKLSPAELDRLGERLETAKKVAPTRPHPATPPIGMVQKTMGLGVAVLDHVRDAVTGRSAMNPPDPRIDQPEVVGPAAIFSMPRFSCIMTECRKAVPVSQGIREAFSTGSHPQ